MRKKSGKNCFFLDETSFCLLIYVIIITDSIESGSRSETIFAYTTFQETLINGNHPTDE